MTIIQGTNKPITFVFANDVSFTDIKVSLNSYTKELKHWNKNDLVIEGNIIQAPLTQEESLSFGQGKATLEVKWLDEDVTEFSNIIPVQIEERKDKTILGG